MAYNHTPANLKVCARRKVPAKHFKICHILYIRKPKVAFSVFHFVLLYFSPDECPDLCRHRPGHSLGEKNKVARNEKRKKQLWGSQSFQCAILEFIWRGFLAQSRLCMQNILTLLSNYYLVRTVTNKEIFSNHNNKKNFPS